MDEVQNNRECQQAGRGGNSCKIKEICEINIMKIIFRTYKFSWIAIVIMCIVFIVNLILSRDYNLLWILLSGGGDIVDSLGVSYTTVCENFQLYRLFTYGYTQTAIWHLLANVLGLWYIGLYLEKYMGKLRFIFLYHGGLVIAGVAILGFYPDRFSCGASPAIFAYLGMLFNWLMRKRDLWKEYKAQKGFSFFLYYFVLSNFLGIHTLLFHLFGFCTGFLLGFIIKRKEEKQQMVSETAT